MKNASHQNHPFLSYLIAEKMICKKKWPSRSLEEVRLVVGILCVSLASTQYLVLVCFLSQITVCK